METIDSLETAVDMLRLAYKRTVENPYISKPISAALYEVWRIVEGREPPQTEGEVTITITAN